MNLQGKGRELTRRTPADRSEEVGKIVSNYTSMRRKKRPKKQKCVFLRSTAHVSAAGLGENGTPNTLP